MAYPLNSKRLKLKYFQHLARTLDLPITASRGDLEVMIGGKLTEMGYNLTNVQVVIVQSGEGEELSLKDIDGTFLVAPPLPMSKDESPIPGEEEYDFNVNVESFSAEMTQL